MARPRQGTTPQRTVRFTDAEWATLLDRAQAAGDADRADYIRRRVLDDNPAQDHVRVLARRVRALAETIVLACDDLLG